MRGGAVHMMQAGVVQCYAARSCSYLLRVKNVDQVHVEVPLEPGHVVRAPVQHLQRIRQRDVAGGTQLAQGQLLHAPVCPRLLQ